MAYNWLPQEFWVLISLPFVSHYPFLWRHFRGTTGIKDINTEPGTSVSSMVVTIHCFVLSCMKVILGITRYNVCTDGYHTIISTRPTFLSLFLKGSETSDQHIRQICRAILEGEYSSYVCRCMFLSGLSCQRDPQTQSHFPEWIKGWIRNVYNNIGQQ